MRNAAWSMLATLALCLAWPGAWATAAEAVAGTGARAASPGAAYVPSVADTSAAALLASARDALTLLAGETEKQTRDIAYAQAVTALTGLYQLHGCQWALPPLKRVLRAADCPDVHVGYSRDGRLLLRVEALPVRSQAFAGYAVYLCTLESHTALDLSAASTQGLCIKLRGGRSAFAEQLAPEHPLWKKAGPIAGTFAPVDEVASGAARAFKQVFAVPGAEPGGGLPRARIAAVSLHWGEYDIDVPYYENEVELERPAIP